MRHTEANNCKVDMNVVKDEMGQTKDVHAKRLSRKSQELVLLSNLVLMPPHFTLKRVLGLLRTYAGAWITGAWINMTNRPLDKNLTTSRSYIN